MTNQSNQIFETVVYTLLIGGIIVGARYIYLQFQKANQEQVVIERKGELRREWCDKNNYKIEENNFTDNYYVNNILNKHHPQVDSNINLNDDPSTPDPSFLNSLCESDNLCFNTQKALESSLQGLGSVKQEYLVLLHLGVTCFYYNNLNKQAFYQDQSNEYQKAIDSLKEQKAVQRTKEITNFENFAEELKLGVQDAHVPSLQALHGTPNMTTTDLV